MGDRRGVGDVTEHVEVVVGREEEGVDAREGGFDGRGDVAEVGGEGHAYAVGGEDEAAGVGGVVGDGEGGDVDVADGELGTGVEVLDGWEVGWVGFLRRGVCGVGDVWGVGIFGVGVGSGVDAGWEVEAGVEAGGLGGDVGDGGGFGGDVVGGGVGCYGGGAGLFFALDVIEPLGVGHGGAGGEHADPGAVGGLGEEDGDAEAAGQDGEAGYVVLMLVGDEDGVELRGVFAG